MYERIPLRSSRLWKDTVSKSFLVAAVSLAFLTLILMPGGQLAVLADLTVEDPMPQQPKDALDPTGEKAISKKVHNGESVKVVPYALEPTEQEEQEKIDAKLKIEKVQLEDLWSATTVRDREVHLSLQKLATHLSSPEMNAEVLNTFNSIVFGGKDAVFSDLLTGKRLSIDKALLARMFPNNQTHAEAVSLFTAARTRADKLETQYKTYTEAMYELANNFSSKRKGRRLKAESIAHARYSRSALVELAGEEAVGRIDDQNGYADLSSRFPIESN